MAEVMNSLFGVTPESLQMQREKQSQQEALNFAQLQDPFARANYQIYQGASGLGRQLGGLFGLEDPELAKATALQSIMKQADTATPEGLATLARTLGSQGFGQQAMAVMDQARQAQLRAAQTGKALAEQSKLELSVTQEENLRKELSDLGPNATEADVLKVVSKYGSADKVLATLQGSADRAATREQQLQIEKDKAAARVQAAQDKADSDMRLAQERGATQVQIAQMAAQSREQIAQMLAQSRKDIAQLAASLKGPSAAVIKAQEKADKIAEGQAGLADTVSVAKTLVKDIADMGGMTTASKGALANLMTSLGTGTVGQVGARLVGTATQAKRDELNSVRLQLFNAVKEATGMSSTQLNSNVELQTWLKSLGSDTMSKEANLAILDNIENRYLKAPKVMGTGTAENPIVLK